MEECLMVSKAQEKSIELKRTLGSSCNMSRITVVIIYMHRLINNYMFKRTIIGQTIIKTRITVVIYARPNK